MATITGSTRGGNAWVPQFVQSIDAKKCIGCGRCYKTCPRNVLELVEREIDDDDDEDYDDDQAMVMTVKDAMDCIGCTACSRVCGRGCFTHGPAEAA